ncbi:MAG: acyl-CoA dehydrogenase family protein [Planctomycetes bacterium]|nr:acyl-CoA dehydrogenase family protein [Planctomycetota bacterium]
MTRHDYLAPAPAEEQKMILDTVADLARDLVAPMAAKIDEDGAMPLELHEALAESGLLAIAIAEEDGGSGFDQQSRVLALAELASASGGCALHLWNQGILGLETLVAAGGKTEFVQNVAMGEASLALAWFEAGDHLDPAACDTVFENGRIDGTKVRVLGGDQADFFCVVAREGDAASLFLLPADRSGLQRGDPARRMGMRPVGAADVVLNGVAVGDEDRLGQAGAAGTILSRVMVCARLGLAAIGAGIARAARDEATRYASERVQFGRPIAELQAVQERLSRTEEAWSGSIALAMTAARLLDAGEDAAQVARLAYVRAAESALVAADDALQVFGGYGYSREYPVERIYRDARYLGCALGGVDRARLEIARAILPKPN